MDGLEAVDAGDETAVARLAREQGYVWLRGLIEPAIAEELVPIVDRASGGDLLELQREILPSAELERVRRHPGMLAALHAILGEVEAEQGDVIRVVAPGDAPTPPHQDAQYLGVERRIWSAWVPLSDCPRSLGALAVWPGSHRLGLLEHDNGGLTPEAMAGAKWASADLACGDVILLSSLTAHKALENREQRPRLSVDCRYAAALRPR